MKKQPFHHLALLLAASSALLLTGCGLNDTTEAVATTSEKGTMKLENTDWVLVELHGKRLETAAHMKAPTLRFDRESGMVAGNSGVNQYGGNYTLAEDSDSIEFGPMRSTMMAGSPEAMDQEQAFLAVLMGRADWRIVENRLELMAADEVKAAFVAVPVARAVVSGTVVYREKVMLRPGSVLEVTLEDASKADAEAEVIASYRAENPGSPPFSFELEYNPSGIDPRFTYSVRARITREGKLIFTSDTMVPVLTHGHGHQVEVLVKGLDSP